MFTLICHIYPGYTVAELLRTPLPVIFALYDRVPEMLTLRGAV